MSEHDYTVELTTNIVAAYVGNNPLPRAEIPALVRSVYQSLHELDQPDAEPEAERGEPAVPVSKSVKRKEIVCLECGQGFKTIKRHLGTSHELTPDAYRAKWDLKPDYPMVAPEYAARRSQLAVDLGLGLKPQAAR